MKKPWRIGRRSNGVIKPKPKKRGQKLKYNAEQLEQLAQEYFDNIDAKNESERLYYEENKCIGLYKPYPYTILGFCNYIGVHKDYMQDMEKNEENSGIIKKLGKK